MVNALYHNPPERIIKLVSDCNKKIKEKEKEYTPDIDLKNEIKNDNNTQKHVQTDALTANLIFSLP